MRFAGDSRWTNGVAPAFLIYLAASVCFFGLGVVRDPAQLLVAAPAGPSDASVYVWSIGWWLYAVRHAINPVFTRVLWAPYGFNVSWGTFSPGLSLLGLPTTALWGPIVSYNLVSLLAPAANATCAFMLCRLFSARFVSAFTGGYVFGFSPYITGQLLGGHPSLTMVPCVPLAAVLVLLFWRGGLSSASFLALTVAVLVAQFLISPEIFATATLFGAISLAMIWLLAAPDRRRFLWTILACLAVAYAISTIIVSPFLYFMFSWPEHFVVYNQDYVSTLKELFIPAPTLLLSHHRLLILTSLRGKNPSDYVDFFEPGLYLGPLVVLVAYFALTNWHLARGKILICLLCIFWLLTIGPYAHIGGISFPLPWYLFARMPLMRYALPGRLALFSYLLLGLIVSILLEDLQSPWYASVLAGLVILTLLPDLPFTSRISSKVDTPEFFLSPGHKELLQGRNVLVLPFGMTANSMLWQAEAGFDFQMSGGWTTGTPAALGSFDVYQALQDDGLMPSNSDSAKMLLSKLHVDTILIPLRDQAAAAEWGAIVKQPAVRVDDVLLINLPRLSEQKARGS